MGFCRVGWTGLLVALLLGASTRGDVLSRVVISEVVPRGGTMGTTELPAYVELALLNVDQPFDLVTLQAAPGRTESIERVFTVTPGAHQDVVLLHEGRWPTALPANATAVAVDDLGLARSASATSRRLVALGGVMDEGFQAAPPPIEAWSDNGDLPVVSDVVTWAEPGWPAAALPGETVWEATVGGALVRRTGEALDFPQVFDMLGGDELSVDTGQPALSPGRINPVLTHAPEPTSLAVFSAAMLVLTRRGRRG